MSEELWDTAQTAEVIRVSPATLRYWRHLGRGPKSFKLGPKRVMYRRADVLAWLEAQYAATVVGG